MQSGGGPGGRFAGRAVLTSSPSPSSSSSAVSTPHLGIDLQHQQHQQQLSRQSLQHQLLRKPEGNEIFLASQAGGIHGLVGGSNLASSSGSLQIAQGHRKLVDLSHQHGLQDGYNKGQGVEQQVLNPVHQAYVQYALQAQQRLVSGMQSQQRLIGNPCGMDQDMQMGNMKMQDFISLQAANQVHMPSSSKKSDEQFFCSERQMEQGQQPTSDFRGDPKHHTPSATVGQIMAANMTRSMQPQATQAQQNFPNIPNNQLAVAAQLQAVQAWALERNIDLSHPANANLMAQLIPLMQSKLASQQRPNDSHASSQSSPATIPKQQVTSPPAGSESSPHNNSSSDASGQSACAKQRQSVPPGPFVSTSNALLPNNSCHATMQQFSVQNHDNQLPHRQALVSGNGMPPMHPPQSSVNASQGLNQSFMGKNTFSGPEILQMQHTRQLNRSAPQSTGPTNDVGTGNQFPPQCGVVNQMPHQRLGFTKHQLHVLKAQILAIRRLKKGDGTLPQELLRAIVPPPLESQFQQALPHAGTSNSDRSAGKSADHMEHAELNEKKPQALASVNRQNNSKEGSFIDEKTSISTVNVHGVPAVMKEPMPAEPTGREEQPSTICSVKQEQDADHGIQKTQVRSDLTVDRGKTVSQPVAVSDAAQVKKPAQTINAPQAKDAGSARKYYGPLFDFPFFTRKHDSFGSGMMVNNNNLTLAYEIKDLLLEEGKDVLNKKRRESLKKIGDLLSINLERKRIRPDLLLRLQIEEKKLRLSDLQARLREEVDQEQQEIMAMPDRPYRKFVRLCERKRMELARQVQASQRASREKQLKLIFQWRKKLLEAHWAIRDARTARNRGVAKYHERMLREFSKRKDDGRNKRMEALKNNDVERYREMLLEQQTSIPGDAAERYTVLSTFLTQTEEYLNKLGSKIAAAKNQQEVEEVAHVAAAAARAQGLSEEEVRAAAACAGEEVMIRNRFSEMIAPKDSSTVSKYYNLAHAVNERVVRQPSMLRAGTLRDYQLVGLQWMLSLYNNKLNGILADEMGLGKTVQVMALIAYLMEYKGNYGPHLIIVPNAVLVNWKSEFHTWLPSASCIFYVGGKEQRSKLFSHEVCALKFNVLVTTYEFIMYDRSKLSKIDWKYIIIDEAQRMKDRESVLARDLDRYRCQRRLLLTGTPLQNDLKELWSLLNLLLPEVFDNRKAFHDWFSQPFQKEGPTHNAEDDWLETEKKVIIIHRLHQILEPFMLRRRVEDVEGSLPPKISIVLRCRMSAIQSAIYDWIKSTGTLRVDPEDEECRIQRNPLYQAKTYKTLNNRCMELRKACNHPLLNYPYFSDLSKDFLVRSCGKLWVMDRILIKLHRTGHRVLLFSTMTKLLDILEEYLQWRRLVYRRIDGTTSLEDRESAIIDFNSPDSDCFIFLLSIRAAGRGLNLQSADTVIIYDPDPNPKNEEQAVARAHRIGQTREVKVIYMEAVVDKISSHQKEDEFRSGGLVDSEDDLAGKDRYMGSIESLIRNNIQQYKIDMADEVINAGRFDQRTTHEERRMTLESLLHDEERYQEYVHDVPSLQEVNRLIARSDEEVELFDQMDEDLDWIEETTGYDKVPEWLRVSTKEVNDTIANLSKKPSKNNNLFTSIGMEVAEIEPGGKRGRPRGKKLPIYSELDYENGEFSEASSEEKNGYSNREDDREIGGSEDEEYTGDGEVPSITKDQLKDNGPVCEDGYEYFQPTEGLNNNHMLDEDGSSGSSSDGQRMPQAASPSISSQKFGSLSALESRPISLSKRRPDELEEGEIAVSGDSHFDRQRSGSWIHDRDEVEDEQILQPTVKRKRSMRFRPRQIVVDRIDEKFTNEKHPLQLGDPSQLPFHVDQKYEVQSGTDSESKIFGELNASKHDRNYSSLKSRRTLPGRRVASASKLHASPKFNKASRVPSPAEEAEHHRESWEGKITSSGGTVRSGTRMSDMIQRKCKNVISKLQRGIDKEGPQIVPMLTDLWRRIQHHGYLGGPGNNFLDLRRIDQRIDRFEYNSITELVSDVQFMLRSAVNYYGCSTEVRTEARKVHDLFHDILRITFPEADFQDARNAVSFSAAPAPAPARQAITGQNKRHKLINEVEPDPAVHPKTLSRSHVPNKEWRFGGGGGRERGHQDDPSPPLAHPGELVICKKRRKEREKSAGKQRVGPAGPLSPPGIRSPVGGLVPKDARVAAQRTPPSQQGWSHQQMSSSVGWANPVKRMRTDAGKRRPSHL